MATEYTGGRLPFHKSESLRMSALAKKVNEEAALSEESKFQQAKLMSDLNQGFRFTKQSSDGEFVSSVAVVTRFGDDLFFVSAIFGTQNLHEIDHDRIRLRVEIRRSNEIGASSRETWYAHKDTAEHNRDRYTALDESSLEEAEFWRRYNTSVVDELKTVELSMMSQNYPKNKGARVTWVADEDRQLRLPPLSSPETHVIEG